MTQETNQTALTIFNFEDHGIRSIVDEQGNPWFVLRDVLEAMESATTTNKALEAIEDGLGKGWSKNIPLQTAGGIQSIVVIAEPAVTFLVSRSNTDTGRRLNRFIHAEVLPTIKATGSYQLADNAPLQKRQQKLIENAQARERIARDYERQARKEAAQAQKNLEHFASVWLGQFPADDRLLRHWEMGHTVRDCVRLNLPYAPYRATLERFRLLKSVGLIDPIKNQSARQLAAMRCAHVSPLTGNPFAPPATR